MDRAAWGLQSMGSQESDTTWDDTTTTTTKTLKSNEVSVISVGVLLTGRLEDEAELSS